MTLSEDFPVCPWCNMENGYQTDSIETLDCSHCGRWFLAICRIKEVQIPRADKSGVYVHQERNYETRKMLTEVLVW